MRTSPRGRDGHPLAQATRRHVELDEPLVEGGGELAVIGDAAEDTGAPPAQGDPVVSSVHGGQFPVRDGRRQINRLGLQVGLHAFGTQFTA